MCEALVSWVPFPHLLAFYIHWLLLIMCQNWWKLRLLGPMTTRLWLGLLKSAFSIDMVPLELLLVMEVVISVVDLLRLCLESIL